ncbi:hypothetical protein ABPG74_007857 [Tetrahymena malaccensis]
MQNLIRPLDQEYFNIERLTQRRKYFKDEKKNNSNKQIPRNFDQDQVIKKEKFQTQTIQRIYNKQRVIYPENQIFLILVDQSQYRIRKANSCKRIPKKCCLITKQIVQNAQVNPSKKKLDNKQKQKNIYYFHFLNFLNSPQTANAVICTEATTENNVLQFHPPAPDTDSPSLASYSILSELYQLTLNPIEDHHKNHKMENIKSRLKCLTVKDNGGRCLYILNYPNVSLANQSRNGLVIGQKKRTKEIYQGNLRE